MEKKGFEYFHLHYKVSEIICIRWIGRSEAPTCYLTPNTRVAVTNGGSAVGAKCCAEFTLCSKTTSSLFIALSNIAAPYHKH